LQEVDTKHHGTSWSASKEMAQAHITSHRCWWS